MKLHYIRAAVPRGGKGGGTTHHLIVAAQTKERALLAVANQAACFTFRAHADKVRLTYIGEETARNGQVFSQRLGESNTADLDPNKTMSIGDVVAHVEKLPMGSLS